MSRPSLLFFINLVSELVDLPVGSMADDVGQTQHHDNNRELAHLQTAMTNMERWLDELARNFREAIVAIGQPSIPSNSPPQHMHRAVPLPLQMNPPA
ncbi:hypothetical protein FNV43_RR00427 [Rhamnella rubrinervis]|uniref:Uncharacterized protein n=1 Tax=Rhamnella rubrinervis TaxID=2594499 RepID=A0A8K0HNM7_9ROSA|nr:hypothetical protein FNV43_RR00427 [Rhamnella rubrinervis]